MNICFHINFVTLCTLCLIDELDESILLDWLKLNVGDPKESLKVLNGVQSKLNKTEAMIQEMRAMGHDLTDDYLVDLNFFSDED